MKKQLIQASATLATSVAIAAVVVSPVLACHPQGKIVKVVQDNTTGSAFVNAGDNTTALAVNQGDTLTYKVTVSNMETQEGDQHQADMTNTVLTDDLPTGVVLVSNPNETVITENLGTISANGSVTREYQVKISDLKVSNANNAVYLTNKACYTSESSLGKQYDQNGCDVAVVKVNITPTPTPSPTPTPTPKPTPAPKTPVALPNTGSGDFIAPAIIVSALGYVGYLIRLKRRAA